jgi:putative heme-binding domain-containing protein
VLVDFGDYLEGELRFPLVRGVAVEPLVDSETPFLRLGRNGVTTIQVQRYYTVAAYGAWGADIAAREAMLDSVIALDKKAAEVVPYLQILLSREPGPEEQRSKAIQAIADVKGGDAGNGQAVFRRLCISCHKVGDAGADFGPEMSKVGERLTGPKLVQSIIDPNADIAEKYLSTSVLTHEGTSITGLVVSETPETLVIFDGKEQKSIPVDQIDERTVLRQSSMPEGLAGTLSPTEFLDVVEYMRQLK